MQYAFDMASLLSSLRASVPKCSDDALDRLAASRDCWPRGTLAVALGRSPALPEAVCWPESEEEVQRLLEWAGREGQPLVPYGGGSGVCGGAAGRPGTVVVDLKRMRAILGLDGSGLRVTVQPGILGQILEDGLAREGFTLGHSPSSIWCSTAGGWAAARSAGQFSSFYGKFEDIVLGMRVATPMGPIATGCLSSPGQEDLQPLILGSEGTLGIITELTLRVAPRPGRRALRAYAFPGLESAFEAMRALMQADLWPVVLRLYDPVDTRVGGRLGPPRAHRASREPGSLSRAWNALEGVDAFRRHVLDVPLLMPRLLNRLASRLGRRVLLLVGWEGPDELVEARLEAARPLLAEGEDLGAGLGEHWRRHRHDVSYKLAPIFARGAFADTMEVASTWSRLPRLYEAVRDALAENTVVMAHFSHAYPEGCSIYFSFVGEGSLERYDRTWERALQAARQAGGTVTHHHGVGILKAEAATRELGWALRSYEKRKKLLDPGGLLNPGRLFQRGLLLDEGPPPPAGGPLLDLDPTSLLADVDPYAGPDALAESLAREGFRMRFPPDRPLAEWLRRFEPWSSDRHVVPLFGLQARYTDGRSARLGLAPRSAAGPDLRWALLADARPERVQVPILPLARARVDMLVEAHEAREAETILRADGYRPEGALSDPGGRLRVVMGGPAAASLAVSLERRLAPGAPPPAPVSGAPKEEAP